MAEEAGICCDKLTEAEKTYGYTNILRNTVSRAPYDWYSVYFKIFEVVDEFNLVNKGKGFYISRSGRVISQDEDIITYIKLRYC